MTDERHLLQQMEQGKSESASERAAGSALLGVLGTSEQAAVRAEADRICHERGVTDPVSRDNIEAAVRHEFFMRATEPYRNEIARLYDLKRIVFDESESTAEYEWMSPEIPKLIAQLHERIAAEADKYGYKMEVLFSPVVRHAR